MLSYSIPKISDPLQSQILEIGEKWLQFSSCFVLACFYRLNLEKCEPNIDRHNANFA